MYLCEVVYEKASPKQMHLPEGLQTKIHRKDFPHETTRDGDVTSPPGDAEYTSSVASLISWICETTRKTRDFSLFF